MRSVAPKYVDGYDLDVETYLEFLERRGVALKSSVGEAVIHDPCFYARFEGVIEEPRSLAARSGLRLLEPPRARRMTYCCGGPVEGIGRLGGELDAVNRLDYNPLVEEANLPQSCMVVEVVKSAYPIHRDIHLIPP